LLILPLMVFAPVLEPLMLTTVLPAAPPVMAPPMSRRAEEAVALLVKVRVPPAP